MRDVMYQFKIGNEMKVIHIYNCEFRFTYATEIYEELKSDEYKYDLITRILNILDIRYMEGVVWLK